MRRSLFVLAICVASGCGFDGIASKAFQDAVDAGGPETGTSLPPKPDASVEDGSVEDASVDAPVDAPIPPDGALVFAPSHLAGGFSLIANDVNITAPTIIDTTNRTLDLNGGGAVVSADIVINNNIAVWSVGALTMTDRLTVIGDRPLAIVAAKTVSIGFVISSFGVLDVPGPGGSTPANGTGKGGNGAKAGNDASGGAGGGHGTAGGVGGNKAGQNGGIAGIVANAAGAALVGGAGGGNGGGYALGVCNDRGLGGAGGGALQISAIGKITFTSTGGIDVGGGAGSGGCRNNGGAAYSGGGGGGAGGFVFLESVAGIQIDLDATIEASGGGGGEGGANGANGNPGVGGQYPSGPALGGTNAGNGGNGGNGGVGGPMASAPGPGMNGGDTGGGGGGATGRVFLRTRGGGAKLVVNGTIAAVRTDDPSF